MLSKLERVYDVDDATEQPPLANVPPPRYQACYTWLCSQLDGYTRGHADEVLRLASFLIMGGLAALVNLAGVWVFSRYTNLPYDLYIVLATEISLLCNFALNDRFTFHALAGSQRRWWVRCARFHGPSGVGFVLTLLIAYAAYHAAHLSPVSAQAVAILIVTLVNFSMHRLWTYRGSSQAPQPAN